MNDMSEMWGKSINGNCLMDGVYVFVYELVGRMGRLEGMLGVHEVCNMLCLQCMILTFLFYLY